MPFHQRCREQVYIVSEQQTVRITRGTGQFTINGRTIEDYFPTEILRMTINEPFKVTESMGEWDISASSIWDDPEACAWCCVPASLTLMGG